jgi:hypothetical protein
MVAASMPPSAITSVFRRNLAPTEACFPLKPVFRFGTLPLDCLAAAQCQERSASLTALVS